MARSQTYYLDLATLQPYLHGKSAILHTSISLPKSREIGHGSLFLRQGKIIGCFLHSSGGGLLAQGEEAYQLLASGKKWQVSIETASEVEQALLHVQGIKPSPPPVSSSPVPLAANAIPRQLCPLDESLLTDLSLQQRTLLRTVYVMVNGTRTVEQIKARLHHLAGIEEALAYLQRQSIIE